MSDVRKHVEEVIRQHQYRVNLTVSDQQTYCECQEGRCDEQGWMLQMDIRDHPAHVAAAIQDALEIWLPPLFANAIHGYADSELAGLPGYGDDPTAEEALTKLNQDAASIATYALTSTKWKPGETS